jgi:hypothetical protein
VFHRIERLGVNRCGVVSPRTGLVLRTCNKGLGPSVVGLARR